jgi:hypothetical protein
VWTPLNCSIQLQASVNTNKSLGHIKAREFLYQVSKYKSLNRAVISVVVWSVFVCLVGWLSLNCGIMYTERTDLVVAILASVMQWILIQV